MSLIALLPDRKVSLDLLYSSEAHYVLDPGYSFLTLELAFSVGENCAGVGLLLDGTLPDEPTLQQLVRTPNFRELSRTSDCDVTPVDGVWDFRRTFFADHLRTNRGYEGPPSFQIKTVIDDQTVNYMGRTAEVPKFSSRSSSAEAGLTLLRFGGVDLKPGTLYLARVGFYLRRGALYKNRWYSQILQVLASQRLSTDFRTHVYSYSAEVVPALTRLGVADRLERSRLWVTSDPFIGTTNVKSTPTSDIWVVALGSKSINLRSPEMSISYSHATSGLYTQRRDDPQAPYSNAHLQLADVPELSEGLANLSPRQDPLFEIEWAVSLPGVTLRGLGRLLLPLITVAGFGLTLAILADAKEAPKWVPIVLVLLVLVVVVATLRQHSPRMRRFAESLK